MIDTIISALPKRVPCHHEVPLGGNEPLGLQCHLYMGRRRRRWGVCSLSPEYGHTHVWTQRIHCVCPGWGRAESGCGWQTDWQIGRHGDLLSWKESVHLCHSLHHPRLSVCPSACLFPLSHRFFLSSFTPRSALFFPFTSRHADAVLSECLGPTRTPVVSLHWVRTVKPSF